MAQGSCYIDFCSYTVVHTTNMTIVANCMVTQSIFQFLAGPLICTFRWWSVEKFQLFDIPFYFVFVSISGQSYGRMPAWIVVHFRLNSSSISGLSYSRFTALLKLADFGPSYGRFPPEVIIRSLVDCKPKLVARLRPQSRELTHLRHNGDESQVDANVDSDGELSVNKQSATKAAPQPAPAVSTLPEI